MIEFQNPAAFFLLLLIPVLFLLRFFKIFRRVTFAAVLSDWNGKSFTWNGHIQKIMSWIARFILFAGFILATTALADPVKVHQEKVIQALVQILFLL